MVLLLHALGVVLLNDSPPCTLGGSRFFEPTGHRAPQLPGCVARWVGSMGGPSGARRTLVRDVKPPWLRRALEASEMLLTDGAFALPGGLSVMPELQLRSGASAFSALQCAEALLSGVAQHERVVAAWCRGCTCPARTRLCACLALVEARNGVLRRAPQVLSPVVALLHPSTGLVQAAESAPAARTALGAAAAAPPVPQAYADIFSDAAALAATVPLLLGESGWETEGSRGRAAALQRFITAARGLFSEAWKEAASPSAGGAFARRRSTTASEVAASRERAAAASLVTEEPNAAEEMLRHLLRRVGGGDAAVGGAGVADALSLMDGARLLQRLSASVRALSERTVEGGEGGEGREGGEGGKGSGEGAGTPGE